METAAAATPASVFEPSVDKPVNRTVCMFPGWLYLFSNLVRSNRTVGVENVQEVMSREEASSIKFRLILDFSQWGGMRMPRSGIFDSDS